MKDPEKLVIIVNDVDESIAVLFEKYQEDLSILEISSMIVARLTRICQEIGDGELFVKFCNERVHLPEDLENTGSLH